MISDSNTVTKVIMMSINKHQVNTLKREMEQLLDKKNNEKMEGQDLDTDNIQEYSLSVLYEG